MLAYPPFESPTIIPIITYPIWPMDEYASIRFMLVWTIYGEWGDFERCTTRHGEGHGWDWELKIRALNHMHLFMIGRCSQSSVYYLFDGWEITAKWYWVGRKNFRDCNCKRNNNIRNNNNKVKRRCSSTFPFIEKKLIPEGHKRPRIYKIK